MRILHVDHVVLRTRDQEAMLAFYCGVLGCTVEKRNEAARLIHLRAGSSLIDLALASGERGDAQPNMDHFCLRIDPFDEAALRRHLASFGIDAGPVHQRFGAAGDGPSIYLQDPEGNTVELKGA